MIAKKVSALFAAIFLAASGPALAGSKNLELGASFSEPQLENLTRQAGLAISYTPLAPAASLGLFGFDIGVAVTAVRIDSNKDFWKDAFVEKPPSYLIFPKIQVQKGLPLGLDVGLTYARMPGTNIGLVGGELKWAILKGTMATPALAVRGDYVQLVGVDDLDLQAYGADLSISKGFAFVTPYAGIGMVWIQAEEKSDSVNLDKVSVSEPKGFVGVKVSLFVLSFVAEAGFSEVPSYSGRLNLSF